LLHSAIIILCATALIIRELNLASVNLSLFAFLLVSLVT
jgi:hypothetical protein